MEKTVRTIRFATSLYSESAIRAAAAAYAETLRISIEKEDGDFAVDVRPAGREELTEDLCDHFANHVLHETISQRHAR